MDFNVDTLSFPLRFPGDVNTGVMHYCSGILENANTVSAFLRSTFIGLVFNLQDDIYYRIGNADPGVLPKRRYCLAYVPSGTIELSTKKDKYTLFCIEFTPNYLASVRDHFPILTEFLKNSEAKSMALFGDPRPIPPNAWTEIQMILGYKESQGESQKFLLGSQYVTVSMDSLRHLGAVGNLAHIDIEKIRKVHDYIQKNFRFSCSVSQLADMAKLNAKQLKHGFKIVYEKPVHKFLIGERMSRSTALLRDTNMSIKEIAVAVGYKNARTFSRIFKKYFGYAPGKTAKKAGE